MSIKLGYNVSTDYFGKIHVEVYKMSKINDLMTEELLSKKEWQVHITKKEFKKPLFFSFFSIKNQNEDTRNRYRNARAWAINQIDMLINNNQVGKYEAIYEEINESKN